jgi:N-acyl-D-aspartate/D-glutamate deacylase
VTDLLIRGGLVIDGTGTPGVRADVAVTDGRVTDVGDVAGRRATRMIDARDRVVAPGFIDIHSHSDNTVLRQRRVRERAAYGRDARRVRELRRLVGARQRSRR